MLTIIRSNKFKTDVKKIKNKKDIEELKSVIVALANNQELDAKYKAHQLIGNYNGYMECHIKPNLLLIYKIDNGELCLYLYRLGSHSMLFKK
ncbi:MAG: type II toxin-antitoxin system YafQ family toxin [Alphaproteobacteria bacterium]